MRNKCVLCRVVFPGMVVLALSATRVAVAQDHGQHQSHDASSAQLRIEVDGSKSPELVSDYHAYRQFIVAASMRDDASQADRRRRQAYVRRIGLSARDEALLNAALRNVRERVDAAAVERKRLGVAAPPLTRVALKQQEEAVFDGANRRLRTFLSQDGWRRLDQFVQKQIKPHIRVYSAESR